MDRNEASHIELEAILQSKLTFCFPSDQGGACCPANQWYMDVVDWHIDRHRRFFDNKSAIHYSHTLSQTCHNSQIVRDPDNGHTKFITQTLHQINDLGLNGHIQSSGRLIRDQNLRTARQAPWRSSHADAYRRKIDEDNHSIDLWVLEFPPYPTIPPHVREPDFWTCPHAA